MLCPDQAGTITRASVASLLLAGFSWIWSDAKAGELILKDGTVIRGSLETPAVLRGDQHATPGFLKIDDGLRRFVLHDKLRDRWNEATPLTSIKPFRITQPLSGRNPNLVIGHVVSIVSISPFDDYGRRTFTVRDARGETAIPQGITEINPDFIKVQSLKHMWESCVSTQAVPPGVIESILRKSTDPKNVDDRLRLVRFFLAAEWFVQADDELQAIAQEFPKLIDEVKEATAILEEAKARRRMREIKLRRAAGQHDLAYRLIGEFPLDSASGEVIVEARDHTKYYENLLERMRVARREIEKLGGQVQDEQLRARLEPPLKEISQFTNHVEGVARLDNFLSLVERADMSAEEKLGAAISGWVAGNAFAEANMDRALLLWDGRTSILQYVNETSDDRRRRILNELRGKEKLSVDLAARVVEHLPPLMATNELAVEKQIKLAVPAAGDRTIDYSVMLPYEYSPLRSYPLIITLHGRGVTPETQLSWWSSPPGFQASRHGFIVVAPEYLADPKQEYAYDATAHDAVIQTLIDVRRRFMVDSDRVFLTGHSMGGDAAWDIGLAHPDLFAGVIPICGAPQKFAEFYWPNAQNTAFYIVDGEKDGTNPEQITKTARRMMENGHDAIYVEFKGRGHENFSDETLRLFEWMGRKTRRKFPLKFTCRTARVTDNEHYFVKVDDFAPAIVMDPHNFDRRKMKPGQIEGRINGIANSVTVLMNGPRQAEVWLSPGMVDFARPVTVHGNREEVSGRAIRPDLEVLLEDFRARADRQKLFYAKVAFPRR